MHSLYTIDRPLRRHDLVFVSPQSWSARLDASGIQSSDPLVLGWAARGWPLVRRRLQSGDRPGIPVGLPLPPSAGKHRLAIVVNIEDVVTVTPAPALGDVVEASPPRWRPTLQKVAWLANKHAVEIRVSGSLAWQALTQLEYLTAGSDLDLLLEISPRTDVLRLTRNLAAIELLAPMRIDGEVIRADGAAVNWRELHGRSEQVLVKRLDEIELLPFAKFLAAPGVLS